MISRTVFVFDCWGLLTVPYHKEQYHVNNICIIYAKVYGALGQSLMEPSFVNLPFSSQPTTCVHNFSTVKQAQISR